MSASSSAGSSAELLSRFPGDCGRGVGDRVRGSGARRLRPRPCPRPPGNRGPAASPQQGGHLLREGGFLEQPVEGLSGSSEIT